MTAVAEDGVLHGHLRIEGTRIGVVHVYDVVVAGGEPAEVADALDLPLGRVYEALAYYYDHPDEMRGVRREENAAFDAAERRSVDPPVEASDAH